MQHVSWNPWHETGVLYFKEKMPRLPIFLSPVNRSCPHYTTSHTHIHTQTHTHTGVGWVSQLYTTALLHYTLLPTLTQRLDHNYFSLCRILTLQRGSCPWLPHRHLQPLSNIPRSSRCTRRGAHPSAPSIRWATCCIPQGRTLHLGASLKTECLEKHRVVLSVWLLASAICKTSAKIHKDMKKNKEFEF